MLIDLDVHYRTLVVCTKPTLKSCALDFVRVKQIWDCPFVLGYVWLRTTPSTNKQSTFQTVRFADMFAGVAKSSTFVLG
jgi:hypothetical protein